MFDLWCYLGFRRRKKLIICFNAQLGVIAHRCLRKPLEEVDPPPYELTCFAQFSGTCHTARFIFTFWRQEVAWSDLLALRIHQCKVHASDSQNVTHKQHWGGYEILMKAVTLLSDGTEWTPSNDLWCCMSMSFVYPEFCLVCSQVALRVPCPQQYTVWRLQLLTWTKHPKN